MDAKPIIKLFSKESITIHITDFRLTDVSIYGCDADFEYEIRDKETGTLLDTDSQRLEYAFMGVDDGDELYLFLKEKGIDFSAEYDDDYDKLPAGLRQEFEQYLIDMYNDLYHDWFFEDEEDAHEDIVEKLHTYLGRPGDIYVIIGDKVGWIDITDDYFGIHLQCDKNVDLHSVYDMNSEEYIYEIGGVYFEPYVIDWRYKRYALRFFERDEDSRYEVTDEDCCEGAFTDYYGGEGDILYSYHEI